VAAREITLPLYPGMTEDVVDYVCGAIHDFFSRERKRP
jgi:dTDP-4-amino-4,6-dideoxygalactose transaminase